MQPSYKWTQWAPWLALALLTVMLMAFGGSARADVPLLWPLRAVAILVAGWMMVTITRDQWQVMRAPLWLWLGLAVIMLAQLLPVPAGWWANLPLRDAAASGHAASGWRPLSLAPALTVNALAALAVPLAVGLAAARTPRLLVLLALVTLGVISALFGFMQIVSAPDGPLFWYQFTNPGAAVGLFANRNHHAAFLLVAMVAAAGLPFGPRDGALYWVRIGVIVLLAIGVLTTSSRAGALFLAGTIFALMLYARWDRDRAPMRWGMIVAGLVIAGVCWALWPVITGVVDRFAGDRVDVDMRVLALPVNIELAARMIPFGAGFGSYASVFQMVEPDILLRPEYMNHAHNDWLQWIIEGGLPAIILGVWMIAWVLQAAIAAGRQGVIPALMIAVFALASIADYPLRTPLGMAALAAAVALLARRDRPEERGPR